MHIGLTFDLRDDYLAAGFGEEETAEFDRTGTIDALAAALQALGHAADRIGHVGRVVERLAAGDRWDLVFNICEGLHGTGREAQVPALLEAFNIPCTFADPCVMAVCLHKGVAKSVIRDAGLLTPRSAVIERLDQVAAAAARLRYPLFAKPLAEGTGKGVTPASRVLDESQLEATCRHLLAAHRQPVLIEEYLPGREFTVGLLDEGPHTQCLGTLEIILRSTAEPDVYSYVNKERCEDLVEYRLVRPEVDPTVARAEALAVAAWQALGCRDAGRVDVRCNATGEPEFLEANPLAGLHPFHSDLPMIATAVGLPYQELIRRIVNAAARRRPAVPPRPLPGMRLSAAQESRS